MLDQPIDIPELHYESLAKLETTYWWHRSRLNWAEKIIKEFFPDPSALNVLDYGCGTGGFLHQINQRIKFNSYMGVDTSSKAIGIAQQYGENFHLIEPYNYDSAAKKDLIFLMDTLEHIENDTDFLQGLLNHMENHAYLLISVPALPRLYSSWDKTLGHFRRYSKKSLIQTASQTCGSIRFIQYCFFYLCPPIWLKRVLIHSDFNINNCEFPPSPKYLNYFLLGLNSLEIFFSKFIKYPFGSSIFCLIQKSQRV